MGNRGRNTYLPKPVIDEVTSIMSEKGIKKQRDGFNLMVNYSKVGREMEYIAALRWPKRKKNGG